jgi:cyclic dehypoxanthinyl futalosine synthase
MGISREQALDCFASDDLIGIGMEADAVRRHLHPEGVVTYAIDRRISLALSLEEIHAAVAAALEQGGTGVTLHGVVGRSLAWVAETFRSVKRAFPQVRLHSLSAPEVKSLQEQSGLSVIEIFAGLQVAGLDSMPGDGIDTLGTKPWIAIHRDAHLSGIPTTASMTFGADESIEERVAVLEAIHMLQSETKGFTAFTLTSHHTPGGRDLDDATAVEYLKTLAICRMVLDNIPNLQANWEQQGLKVLQMGLRFGGNDVGSILGASGAAPEEEVRRIIRDAGFKPVQRDTLYRAHLLA